VGAGKRRHDDFPFSFVILSISAWGRGGAADIHAVMRGWTAGDRHAVTSRHYLGTQEIHPVPAPPRASHTPQILCKFGVNALSSKSPNAIKLDELGRLIEGPGRPIKQRFAIPAMAQGA
jgi:hypothetical protein